MPPELSGMTAIHLVFQVDGGHEKITDIYVGLVVCQVDSSLYSPSQISKFIQDTEGNLKVACNALKARCNPGKRCTYCLFLDNLSGIMSIPTDPPYCLVYPTSYVKGIEPDHFDTRNSPGGHACIIVCVVQPCSSVTMIPNCILNTSGVTSSCPVGCSTMISFTLPF